MQIDSYVGRHKLQNGNCVDVIFDSETKGFTEEEVECWTQGNVGYWYGWTYDLDDPIVSEIAMKMIESMPTEGRDPLKVVRHLAANLNEANNPNGILHGMWDKTRFIEGREPSYWRSTGHALSQYQGEPVKFFQCWGFAEILTSLTRVLGITSRTIYISNARIDSGRDGGIDIGFATNKGDGSIYEYEGFDPVPSTLPLQCLDTEEKFGEVFLKIEENFSNFIPDEIEYPEYESSRSKGNEEMENLICGVDGAWNFHLMTEVYIDGKWHCVDACPISITESEDEYKGQKVLGPCLVKSIKTRNVCDHDYSYFNSSFNAFYRYWKTSTTITGDVITYPADILFANAGKAVKVSTQDPKNYRNKIDISDSYLARFPGLYYIKYPFYIDSSTFQIVINKEIEVPHLIQVCYIDQDGELLNCDRKTLHKISDYKLQSIPKKTLKISCFFINLVSKKWWSHIVVL
jgi:hypothetical protein